MRCNDCLDVRLGVQGDIKDSGLENELGQEPMALVDCRALYHHVVVQWRHEGSDFLIVAQALLEETFIDPLDKATIFVVELGDK